MANTQALQRRIKSVKNTKQITKAMELVAASKMRKAQEATLRTRAYRNTAREILTRINLLTDVSKHPLFSIRPVRSRLYIVITSDRGLAGAYNVNIFKLLTSQLQEDLQAGVKSKVIVIGKLGARFIAKLDNVDIVGVYEDFADNPTNADIAPIIATAMDNFVGKSIDMRSIGKDIDEDSDTEEVASYNYSLPEDPGVVTRIVSWLRGKKLGLDGANAASLFQKMQEDGTLTDDEAQEAMASLPQCDEVKVVYTDFKSSIVQEALSETILPATFVPDDTAHDLETGDIPFEPSPRKVLETIVPRLLQIQFLQANLESLASEHSMRMLAMKNASDNAGDLIDELTLAFNSARQAAITQEIAEISGGADAIS